MWNLLLVEKEVRGTLVALSLVGRFKWSSAVRKSTTVFSSWLREGKGSEGVSPS
jgi:hypothetical protein